MEKNAQTGKNPAEKTLQKLRRNGTIALLIVVGTVVIAVGSVVDAGTKISKFVTALLNHGDPTPMDPNPSVAEVQGRVLRKAKQLADEFNSKTNRKSPPIPVAA